MKQPSKYQKIESLIQSADIKKALTLMYDLTNSLESERLNDTTSSLLARFNRLKESSNNGIISNEEESTERNRINSSALDILRNLKEKDTSKEVVKEVSQEKKITEDDFFRIAKAANIIIELEKIKEQFYIAEWNERRKVLSELFKYSDHKSIRVSKEIFSFLSNIASLTRSGMKSDVAYTIESLIIHYFPYFERGNEGVDYEKFAFEALQIGFNIFYDSAIYLQDYKVGGKALQIMKRIYWKAKDRDNQVVMKMVFKIYDELEETLNRTERDDLEITKEVLQVFKNDLDNRGIFPIKIPKHILEIV